MKWVEKICLYSPFSLLIHCITLIVLFFLKKPNCTRNFTIAVYYQLPLPVSFRQMCVDFFLSKWSLTEQQTTKTQIHMLRELSWAWLADNFKSGSTLAAGLICPPLVYSMTDSCDAKFGHSPMNIKSWGDDDWIFHMWDSQPDNILFWVCSQIVMGINESYILYRSDVQSVHMVTKVI